MVDDTGIEPVTPSMSRKCATAALIVRSANYTFLKMHMFFTWRWRRDLNPCSGICSPEPRLSATPPNLELFFLSPNSIRRADDGGRTRDLNLGKVPRYQLRYVRIYWHLPIRVRNLSQLEHSAQVIPKMKAGCSEDSQYLDT